MLYTKPFPRIYITNRACFIEIHSARSFKKTNLSHSSSSDYRTFLHNSITKQRKMICYIQQPSLKNHLTMEVTSKSSQPSLSYKRPELYSHLHLSLYHFSIHKCRKTNQRSWILINIFIYSKGCICLYDTKKYYFISIY